MINFRYHVVSLVGMFLALGLGILFGASFIDQAIVKQLEDSQTATNKRLKAQRAELDSLESKGEGLTEYAERTKDRLIAGAIKDRIVVIVASQRAGETAGVVTETLTKGGGQVAGTVTLTERLSLKSPERRRAVALALGTAEEGEASLQGVLTAEMADVLSSKKPGVLEKLATAELIEIKPGPGPNPLRASETVPAGALIVFVWDRADAALVTPQMESIVRQLVERQVVVAVVEEGAKNLVALGNLRRESTRAVTVDSVETAPGQVSLVWGLRAAIAGKYGHYGVGPGATSPVPEFTP